MKMMKKKMSTNEENLPEIREAIEQKFKRFLEEGKDIKIFLYYPVDFLSDYVKEQLDIFLMEKAYDEISKDTFDPEVFVVYSDNLLTISLEENHQRVEVLERLIKNLVEYEEYEKCAKLQNLLNTIKNE